MEDRRDLLSWSCSTARRVIAHQVLLQLAPCTAASGWAWEDTGWSNWVRLNPMTSRRGYFTISVGSRTLKFPQKSMCSLEDLWSYPQNCSGSGGSATRPKRQMHFEKVKVPADGMCGWYALLASEDPFSWQKNILTMRHHTQSTH